MKTFGFYFIILTSLLFSCNKLRNVSKKDLITADWTIHHIYIRTYQNGVLLSDTTLPNHPQPKNYINFNSNGSLEYKYNSTIAETGTWELKGDDSVYATIGTKQYKWHVELLIRTNFNVMASSTSSAPGKVVETYQSFVK